MWNTRVKPEEHLRMLLGAAVRDIDRECENTARNCYTCKKVAKCQIAITKEAFCRIHNGTKCMNSDEYIKLRDEYWKAVE